LFCFGDSGDWAKGFKHAKHVLYHWAVSPALSTFFFFFLFCFWC
jgi:hypothetical protein